MTEPRKRQAEELTPRADETTQRSPRFRVLHLVGVAAVASLLALLIWRVAFGDSGAHLVAAIRDGKKPSAPGFRLDVIWPHAETWPPELRPAVTDGKVAPAELKGYPVVINFWASWCIPCKREAPRLAASARKHAGNVVFLGIDIQDFKSDARSFLARYDANYVSVRDGSDSTYTRYGLTGVPETYYIDRRGRIVAHSIGEVSRGELEDGITGANQP